MLIALISRLDILFERANKEMLLAWRRFLIIIFVCYLPIIFFLYGVYFACHNYSYVGFPAGLFPWWLGSYFGYSVLVILSGKHTKLQSGWIKFIVLATVGYVLMTILLVFLSILFDYPLGCILAWSSTACILPGGFTTHF